MNSFGRPLRYTFRANFRWNLQQNLWVNLYENLDAELWLKLRGNFGTDNIHWNLYDKVENERLN